ncbi:UNVERIFIED_CONTAM: Hydroxyproline O-arabinosyltransferase 1 [Sesamum radiatum]|uniref:Hydroxyproline O-arabinosyltransferase 1 n=2 Tax=Sesamum TaxID=4181 RepID=A0AAW2MG78_SESRA
MGCGNLFFTLVITFSAALITYNIIISANASLKQDFPDPSRKSASSFSLDPVIKMPTALSSSSQRSKKRLFHTAVTASDSIYNTWQCRVMYYWFKKQKNNKPNSGGASPEFCILGTPTDSWMRSPPLLLSPSPTEWIRMWFPFTLILVEILMANNSSLCTYQKLPTGYIVLNRPWAFVQWLQQAKIEEDYILMSEPDHILVKPIPNLSRDGLGAAFPFFYIEPKKYETVLRKFFPEENGPITNIDPIGNSPVIVGKDALKKIAPTWMNVSLAMKKDPEADKAFGWVLEMYAYAVASALHGVGNILYKEFMIQPPWDTTIGKAYIIHYTYGCDYDLQGKLTYGKIGEWRFDKRSYDNIWPPRNLTLPPPGVPESVSVRMQHSAVELSGSYILP